MNRVRSEIHVEEAYRRGIRGKGIGVAVLDTGISPHPDLRGRIVYFRDFLYGRRECYDDCSHGTHVCGILGGSGAASGGKYRGVAPECHFIGLKVLDRMGNGNKEEVLRGIDWVIRNRERYGIRILNISVGTVRESAAVDTQLVEAVERAWDAGLVVVVAAGNMGPEPMSITVPGNSRKVITVGAADDCSTEPHSGIKPRLVGTPEFTRLREGRTSCCKEGYSGRGPTAECICKPDITAPGSGIVSCGTAWGPQGRYYVKKSGTSMATPIVSGCIALLLSEKPDITNVEVKIRLHDTATDLGLPRRRQGWGQIDAQKLLLTR